MICKTREGQTVECELEFSTHVEDSFIYKAVDYETGTEVNEQTLNELNEDYQMEIDEMWHEHQIGRSEDYGSDR